MSTLRARCPDCGTLTAVAIGPDYQCHSCGREFAAGLVRVPRAWGDGGEGMAAAAAMFVPWPEAAVIEEDTLEAQFETQVRELPQRPLVMNRFFSELNNRARLDITPRADVVREASGCWA